jgi:hypothetical protein
MSDPSKQGNVAKPTLHHLGTNVKWDEDPLGSLLHVGSGLRVSDDCTV